MMEEKQKDKGEGAAKPTYERLYDLNKEKIAKQVHNTLAVEEADEMNNTRHGAANKSMRGDKTLQEFLYGDDKRRREEN